MRALVRLLALLALLGSPALAQSLDPAKTPPLTAKSLRLGGAITCASGTTCDVSPLSVTAGGTTQPLSTWLPGFAPKASPTFTGTVTAPSLALSGTSSTGEVPGLTVSGRSLATWLTGQRTLLLTWFGCDPTGVADSTSCVTTAVNTAKALGGATIGVNGQFAISSEVRVDRSNIGFEGYGYDARHDVAPPSSAAANYNNSQPASAFIWKGATGGTMVRFEPAADQQAALGGIKSVGVAYICSIFPNTSNVADYGLVVRGAVSGTFDVFGQECGQANVLFDTVRRTPAPFEDSPRFLYVPRIEGRNLATNGALLKLDGQAGYGNTYNNRFGLVTGLYKNGIGFHLGNSDNNTVETVRLQRADGGTGIGIKLSGGTATDNMARANVFNLVSPGAGGVLAEGGAFPSYQNKINWYNPEENNAPFTPTIQAGATLFWRSTQQMGVSTTSVGLSANQSMPSATFTKLAFNTARADIIGQFVAASNRIQPKYPGQYRIALSVFVTNPDASNSSFQLRLRKNDGTVTAFRTIQTLMPSQGGTLSLSVPVYLNGTTDYVEADLRNGAVAAATVDAGADVTSFSLMPIN